MSNSYSDRREMQPDVTVGINLPTSAIPANEYRACHIWYIFIHRETILQRPDEKGRTTLKKNCFAELIYCQQWIARLHFFPLDHAHMKAPLKIMQGLTEQLSLFKVRVFIKIDRLTGRYFEVLPLPWPLQKGSVRLAIWDVFLWSDKHSLQLLLFKPYQSCDLN